MPATAEFTVVSCNTLLDTRPDAAYAPNPERLSGILEVIKGYKPDVVSLFEVEGTASNNPATDVAAELGLEHGVFGGYGRPKEGMVMASRFSPPQTLNLDPDHLSRLAQVSTGEIAEESFAVIGTHPSHFVIKGIELRRRQMNALLQKTSHHDRRVVMGDLNAMPWQQSRRILRKVGFQSVLAPLGNPPTYPTDASRCDIGAPKIAQRLMQTAFRARGVSLDDIAIEGPHEVLDAGLINPEGYRDLSDHFGVWATIRWTSLDSSSAEQEAA